MKKHLTLMGLIALSISALQAASICEPECEAPKPPETCGVSCTNCEILNPYQNSDCDTSLIFGLGYVGGYFAPQNLVVAQNGVYNARVVSPATQGQFIDAQIGLSSGVQLTAGFSGAGQCALGVVGSVLFISNKGTLDLTTLLPTSTSMKTTYPIDLVNEAGTNDWNEPIGNVFVAGAEYVNEGYLFATLMLAKPQIATKCSILSGELGVSTTLLYHGFGIVYGETNLATITEHVYTTKESITSFGPHARLKFRFFLLNCATLQGMMGTAGYRQSNDVDVSELVTQTTITGGAVVKTSRVNVAKLMQRWTNLVEGQVGINFHACHDKVNGFCVSRPDCKPPKASFTSLEFGLSWNFHARPAFTMVTDVPYGISAGTMQPWVGQYLLASFTVKL